jgi:hypothetical protein
MRYKSRKIGIDRYRYIKFLVIRSKYDKEKARNRIGNYEIWNFGILSIKFA